MIFLKRKLIDKFIEWKNRVDIGDMPMFLIGARGVGKTYLAYEFANDFFQHMIYFNFETQPSINQDMEQGQDLFFKKYFEQILVHRKEIPMVIEDELEEPEDIICILDEVSHCANVPKLWHLLHSLNEERKTTGRKPITILMISSSWKNVLRQLWDHNIQFKEFTLYPMNMEEFLLATGNEWYVGVINEHFATNKKIPDIVHKELLALFDVYIRLGGMPAAINEYFAVPKIDNISEKHRILLQGLLGDVAEENDSSESLKIMQVFSTLHTQLIKPNKKFQYRQIRKGATKQMYESAIEYLVDHNYVLKASKLQQEGDSQFKLYLQDTGLLSTIYRMNYGLLGECSDKEIQKALIENSVAQALNANGYPLVYWESTSQAKVEFVLGEKKLLPIEVRSDDKTRSKNFSIMKEEYAIDSAVKISSRNFEYSNKVKYIPYYAVYCL